MHFDLTDEQEMLRSSVSAYLRDNYDIASRASAIKSGQGWRPDVWLALAQDIGLMGAAFPESLGGFGGSAIENMVIMEEFGKALVLEPYLPTVVIGGGFLRRSSHPAAQDLVAGIIAGETIFAFAHAEKGGRYNLAAVTTTAIGDGAGWVLNGQKLAVVAAPIASHLIVTARTAGGAYEREGISVFLLPRDAPGVVMDARIDADGRTIADVSFDNVRVGAEGLIGIRDGGLALVEAVVDDALAALCGEACGVMRVLLDSTVEYSKQRKQFGVAIGSFQALQHRMADMFVHFEQSVSMTYLATIKVSVGDAQTVSAAKARVGMACRFIGESAVQIHGGMGMTEEMAISHYFKRAIMIENTFGSVDHHLARFERLGR